MAKVIYYLYERNFNQPTFPSFLSGFRVRDHYCGKTTSKKKADEWAKGEMKYYTTNPKL